MVATGIFLQIKQIETTLAARLLRYSGQSQGTKRRPQSLAGELLLLLQVAHK